MIGPQEFAVRCAQIAATERGHAAHRGLDLLTNEVLRDLGYGEGIAIFEAAVARWHEETHTYPYPAACPNCEEAAASAITALQARVVELEEGLEPCAFMLEAVTTQLRSWGIEPAVNVEFALSKARSLSSREG